MTKFHPTIVGEELGFDSWHHANQLIARIVKDKGLNIKASDNKYHVAVMAGKIMQTHKYSQAAIDLLSSVMKGNDYHVEI